jgi:hypothetical protein
VNRCTWLGEKAIAPLFTVTSSKGQFSYYYRNIYIVCPLSIVIIWPVMPSCSRLEQMKCAMSSCVDVCFNKRLGASLSSCSSLPAHHLVVPKIMLDPVPQGTTYRRLGESRVDMTIGFLFKTSQLPLPFAALNMYECFKQALLEHTGDRIAETLPHVTESGPYDYKDCLDARSLTRISTP